MMPRRHFSLRRLLLPDTLDADASLLEIRLLPFAAEPSA